MIPRVVMSKMPSIELDLTNFLDDFLRKMGFLTKKEFQFTTKYLNIPNLANTISDNDISQLRIDLLAIFPHKDDKDLELYFFETESSFFVTHPTVYRLCADYVYLLMPADVLKKHSPLYIEQQIKWAQQEGIGIITVDLEQQQLTLLQTAQRQSIDRLIKLTILSLFFTTFSRKNEKHKRLEAVTVNSNVLTNNPKITPSENPQLENTNQNVINDLQRFKNGMSKLINQLHMFYENNKPELLLQKSWEIVNSVTSFLLPHGSDLKEKMAALLPKTQWNNFERFLNIINSRSMDAEDLRFLVKFTVWLVNTLLE